VTDLFSDPAVSRGETLYCQRGDHHWTRPPSRGTKPYNCPEHRRGRPQGAGPTRQSRHRDESPPPLEDGDGRLLAFAYLTAEKAHHYRLAVGALADLRRERFVLQARPAEIARHLVERGCAPEDAEAAASEALFDQLVAWGNLVRLQDTAEVATLREFQSRRALYQLSAAGEAAERAVGRFLEDVADRARLSRGALRAVLEYLRSIVAASGELDGVRLRHTFDALMQQFSALGDQAAAFLIDVGRTVEACAADSAAFRLYKQAVCEYVQDFIGDLVGAAPRIVDELHRVEEAGLDRLIESAAESEAPPAMEGVPVDAWGPRIAARWAGMRRWFVGEGGAEPTVDQLRREARRAVIRTLAVLERLNEARVRRVSRTADLVQLARWFLDVELTPDPGALFAQAFGVYGWCHLGALSSEPLRPQASWWETEPVAVHSRLVTTRSRDRGARGAQLEDFSAAKGMLAQRSAAARREADRALRRLVDPGVVRLGELGTVTSAELRCLLDLLDSALAAPPARDGVRTALSRDGRVRIVLHPPPGGAIAVIRAPHGMLTLPDMRLELRSTLRLRAVS
jgi:uncharacterized protein (TIGR02677 family)